MNPLDGLRIIGGLLLLNAFLSWWFTSSGTWGYQGHKIDPNYWVDVAKEAVWGPRHMSMAELQQYNGVHRPRVYLLVNGTVFDVTRRRDLYTGKGSYLKLAGRDCSRVLVTGCLDRPQEYTHDLRGLDANEVDDKLGGWLRYYRNLPDYWPVGSVELDPVEGPVPEKCDHRVRPL